MADALDLVPRDGLGIAIIEACRGVSCDRIGDALGFPVPLKPSVSGDEELALIGISPTTWLAITKYATSEWPHALADRFAGLASVFDQSAAYVVLRLQGEKARALLQAGTSIDLNPASFGPGSAAATVIAHIGVLLWQVDDGPTFGLAFYRSYAGSMTKWLEQNVAGLR